MLRAWWKRLFRKNHSHGSLSMSPKRARSWTTLHLEPLEERQLLSTTPVVPPGIARCNLWAPPGAEQVPLAVLPVEGQLASTAAGQVRGQVFFLDIDGAADV